MVNYVKIDLSNEYFENNQSNKNSIQMRMQYAF